MTDILDEAKRLLEKLDSDKDVHWFQMVRALRELVEYAEKKENATLRKELDKSYQTVYDKDQTIDDLRKEVERWKDLAMKAESTTIIDVHELEQEIEFLKDSNTKLMCANFRLVGDVVRLEKEQRKYDAMQVTDD